MFSFQKQGGHCSDRLPLIGAAPSRVLLSVEGHTIGALLYGGIRLMRADTDHFQRAVVLFAAVVLALGHGALNAAVRIGIAVHILTSSLIGWS